MTTLEEALTGGRGTERPFNCPTHGDRHASASVNVLKGVWYCYTCHASGSVAGAPPPSAEQLLAMVSPDKAQERILSPQWTSLISDDSGYWAHRLGPTTADYYRFGTHPSLPLPIYLVTNERGQFVGYVTRSPEGVKPKYIYPRGFAASRNLFGVDRPPITTGVMDEVVVLVESAADVAVLGQMGVQAVGCYGSGLHAPQKELLRRHFFRRRVLVGFDTDLAGERGAQLAIDSLTSDGVSCDRVVWPVLDPSSSGPRESLDAVRSVVPSTYVSSGRRGRG